MQDMPLIVAPSPHVRDADSVPRIMWGVVIALAPVMVASLYFFGANAAIMYALAVAAALPRMVPMR